MSGPRGRDAVRTEERRELATGATREDGAVERPVGEREAR